MKKIVALCLIAVAISTHAWAQLSPDEVVKAERAFARMARDFSTKKAFLSFLADSGVVFSQGRPSNGIAVWSKRQEGNALLDWWPVFADISASGDLGYTTGPFQYFAARSDETPVATGYYSTVWKKQADGSWKVMVDLGTALPKDAALPKDLQVATLPDPRISRKGNDFASFENQYNERLGKTNVSVEPDMLANQFRIHRDLLVPIISKGALSNVTDENARYEFERNGGGASEAGDFQYSYGSVRIIKSGNPEKVSRKNYLRVWRAVDGAWKLVLDVIGN